MAYPSPTTVNYSKGLGEVLSYTNEVTSNWLSNTILMAIWLIVLVAYYKVNEDFAGALAVAGFGTFVIALFFWLGGFISGGVLAIAVAFLLIGIIVLMADQQN